MAVEVEGTSQVEEFLGILRRRVWWIAIPTILLTTIGISVAIIVPKKYVAGAQVLVRDVQGSIRSNTAGAVSRLEGQVAPHVIKSLERVSQVLTDLRWPDYLGRSLEEQHEYRKNLIDNFSIDLFAVQNNAGAQIVSMRFGHTDPQRAYEFLSRVLNSWKSEVQNRFYTSERSRLEKLRSAETTLEADRMRVNTELELKRRANNIRPGIVLDARGGTPNPIASGEFEEKERIDRAIDADVEALRELEVELARLQADYDAEREKIPSSEVIETGTGVLSEIAALEKRRTELELEIERNGWTVHNRSRKLVQEEIDAIQRKLGELRSGGVGGARRIEEEVINPRRIELGRRIEEAQANYAAIDARRARNVLRQAQLQDVTTRLFREIQDIKLLEAEFEDYSERIKEIGKERELQESQVATIESDAGQFFEDLELPIVPTKATTPNPYIISVLSILVGLGLGFGLAILLEVSRSTFRNARDLSRVMAIPVLGTVNSIVTRRQRARVFFGRVAMAVSTMAFVSIVGYVTWAWSYDPDALSAPVLELIKGLREPFL